MHKIYQSLLKSFYAVYSCYIYEMISFKFFCYYKFPLLKLLYFSVNIFLKISKTFRFTFVRFTIFHRFTIKLRYLFVLYFELTKRFRFTFSIYCEIPYLVTRFHRFEFFWIYENFQCKIWRKVSVREKNSLDWKIPSFLFLKKCLTNPSRFTMVDHDVSRHF